MLKQISLSLLSVLLISCGDSEKSFEQVPSSSPLIFQGQEENPENITQQENMPKDFKQKNYLIISSLDNSERIRIAQASPLIEFFKQQINLEKLDQETAPRIPFSHHSYFIEFPSQMKKFDYIKSNINEKIKLNLELRYENPEDFKSIQEQRTFLTSLNDPSKTSELFFNEMNNLELEVPINQNSYLINISNPNEEKVNKLYILKNDHLEVYPLNEMTLKNQLLLIDPYSKLEDSIFFKGHFSWKKLYFSNGVLIYQSNFNYQPDEKLFKELKFSTNLENELDHMIKNSSLLVLENPILNSYRVIPDISQSCSNSFDSEKVVLKKHNILHSPSLLKTLIDSFSIETPSKTIFLRDLVESESIQVSDNRVFISLKKLNGTIVKNINFHDFFKKRVFYKVTRRQENNCSVYSSILFKDNYTELQAFLYTY